MKKKMVWLIFILMTLVMISCGHDSTTTSEYYYGPSSGNETVNTPELYGVGVAMPAKPALSMMTSSLYKLDAGTGAAMLIGDTGYYITGIAYDSNKKKLFGIATNMMNVQNDVKGVDFGGPSFGSQLIEINMSSGEGKLIGEIREEGFKAVELVSVDGNGGFSNPTFNSAGVLYAWNNDRGMVCTINVKNGQAECKGKFKKPEYKNVVMSFDNKNLLYILEGLKIFTLGKYDDKKEFQGMLPDNFFGVYNGDFHPLTGQFWGLYSRNYFDVGDKNIEKDVKGGGPEEEIPGNLLIIDINEKLLMNALTVPDNIEAITWVYNPWEEYK